MTQETNPEKNQPPRAADHAQPEEPRRKKKAPPIDFNALDDHEQKLVRSIATTGARVAGRQQKRTEAHRRPAEGDEGYSGRHLRQRRRGGPALHRGGLQGDARLRHLGEREEDRLARSVPARLGPRLPARRLIQPPSRFSQGRSKCCALLRLPGPYAVGSAPTWQSR